MRRRCFLRSAGDRGGAPSRAPAAAWKAKAARGTGRIHSKYLSGDGPLDPDETQSATEHLAQVDQAASALVSDSPVWFEGIADAAKLADVGDVRTPSTYREGPVWREQVVPLIRAAAAGMHRVIKPLDSLIATLDGLPHEVRTRDAQLLFDLNRARRRLGDKAKMANHFQGVDLPDDGLLATEEEKWVSWLARDRGHRAAPAARLCLAPIDVGPMLRQRLFEAMPAAVVTSATLTVAKQFDHIRSRIGLTHCERLETARYLSPFDYRRQALLGIPRDLPTPKEPGFEERAAKVILEAIEAADGGTFVLCTSYALVNMLHAQADAAFGHDRPLLKQGQMSRGRLLERFREDRRSVLFGTDSFWEGIDVKGDQLRLVIIPRPLSRTDRARSAGALRAPPSSRPRPLSCVCAPPGGASLPPRLWSADSDAERPGNCSAARPSGHESMVRPSLSRLAARRPPCSGSGARGPDANTRRC